MPTHAHQQLFGLFQVVSIIAVGVQTQVLQGGGQHVVTGVEHGNAATGQFGGNLRIEDQVPGVERGVLTEDGLDLVDVVADTVGAPHIGNRVLAARVDAVHLVHQRRVEVFHVRQFAVVQRLVYTCLDLLGQEMIGRHDYIEAGAASEQLGIQHLVGVVYVIGHLDASFLLEVGDGVLGDVVGPVV